MSFLNAWIPFSQWLAATPLSVGIQNMIWIIPLVQCVHIFAIAAIVGAVLMVDLRILELAGRSQSMTSTARRFTPWIWWGALVAVTTGLIMIVGEPVRELVNPAFWTKMVLLAIGLLSTLAFQVTLNKNLAFWEESSTGRKLTRVAAVATLLVWCGVMVMGRLIAYLQIQVN